MGSEAQAGYQREHPWREDRLGQRQHRTSFGLTTDREGY